MKYLSILILLVPAILLGQPKQTFRVKLTDYSIDKIPPYCGDMAFATTLKFELVETVDTLKKGQEILVIIACPREFGAEKYVNTKKYSLTIYGDTEEDQKHKKYGWTIWYKYENEKLPTFWAKELKE